MADFVYANVSLPADKSDKITLAGGEDPLKNVVATDYNAITAALKSARSAILAMSPGATVPGTLYAQPSDVPAGTAVLMGKATDGATAVGVAIDNSVSLANAAARLISIRNLGTERLWVDNQGTITIAQNSGLNAILKTSQGGQGVTLKGNMLAAGTGADVILTGQVTRTAGAVVSFQNNGVEVSRVNATTGDFVIASTGWFANRAANTSATLSGNKVAGDAGADVVLNGVVTRTAGLLTDIQNNGVSKANIDFNGVGTFAGLKSSSALVFSKRTTVADIAYTALVTDYLISYTSITAARVVTLPTAVGNAGLTFIIKDESGSASGVKTISVLAPAGQAVDGTVNPTTVVVVNTAFGAACLYSNGANWFQLY